MAPNGNEYNELILTLFGKLHANPGRQIDATVRERRQSDPEQNLQPVAADRTCRTAAWPVLTGLIYRHCRKALNGL